MHALYMFLLLLATLSNSFLILYLLRRSTLRITLSTFIVLLMLINAWAIPQLFIIIFHPSNELFVLIDKISALGYVFIPVVFSLFAISYTNTWHLAKHPLFFILVFMPSITFLYLSWNTSLIESRVYSEYEITDWGYRVPTGELFSLIVIWFEGLVIFSIAIIWNSYRRMVDDVRRKQAMFLMIGISIPLTFGSITNAILPLFNFFTFPVAIPLTSVMALFIAYAINQYGLFERSSDDILSNIGIGVITLNRKHQIVRINPCGEQLLGIDSNHLIGKKLKKVIKIKRIQDILKKHPHRDPIQYVFKSGKQIVSTEYELKATWGKVFIIEGSFTPLMNKGVITGMTIVFTDITKDIELIRTKNEFISIASHELKTPLTAAVASSQMLSKRLHIRLSQKDNLLLETINDQLSKMKKLIDDLLSVSHIENGIFTVKRKSFLLQEVVKQSINDMQRNTFSHHIIMHGNSEKYVLIDRGRIYEVIVNLISNAIKYSPQESTIFVTITETDKDIIVSVKDFGIGINPKDHKKVFSRFYRTKESRASNIVGFGLGLYICSNIIKSHHGKLWLESHSGRGAIFSFSLPIQKGRLTV